MANTTNRPARDPNRPGNADNITRQYFDSLLIKLRHIDGGIPNTKIELFGEKFDTPIMMAALSHLDKYRPDGTTVMARGAKDANAVNWVGLCDTDDEVRSICNTGAKTIWIIKPSADESVIFRHIELAEEVGCLAIGMDVDHAFTKNGTYMTLFGDALESKTLKQIEKYVKATKLPFIVKGVLHVDDAKKSVEAGASGIVLSHHHGIFDFAVPPVMVLPEIKEAVGEKIKIFVDCGITSGIDAFKALALGADAVSVGRPVMPVIEKSGSEGVTELIKEYTAQLAGAMGFTATIDIAHMDPSVIVSKK